MSALLAALGGVLAWLGFAGVGFWPLALVAFVPLFAALERGARSGGWRAFGLGLVFSSVTWADVAMLEGTTPYQVLGDWPGWLGLGASVWLAFLRREVGAAA